MNFWWVNQGQTFNEEQSGGLLWSPKRKSDGGKFAFYETMKEVAPGDVVFCYSGARVMAIGKVTSYCYESPRPEEFPLNINTSRWSEIGWRVDVDYRRDIDQIRPKDNIEVLLPLLPSKYSPLRPDGNGNQNLYLARIPTNMAEAMIRLIKPPFDIATEPVAESAQKSPAKEAWEVDILESIQNDPNIPETEKQAIGKARIGQGLFRERLLQVEEKCRISGIKEPAFLVAGHIKPWRHSSNVERLDGENGLLLCPNADRLFDRGFISFSNDGVVLSAASISPDSLRLLGIEAGKNVGSFSDRQRAYLEYHRQFIFLG